MTSSASEGIIENQESLKKDGGDFTDMITGCNDNSRKGGRVQLSTVFHIELIPTLEEYSRKEMKACWYTSEEKDKMRIRQRKIISRLESGISPNDGQTYRGLEGYSEQGHREMKAAIIRCIDAVMDEQDRQWRIFRDDYDQIAAVSIQASGQSRLQALETAHHDAQAAFDEIEDQSASEAGSENATIESLLPVQTKGTSRREKYCKSHTKKGSRKGIPGNADGKDARRGYDALPQMACRANSKSCTFVKRTTKKSPIRGQGIAKTRSG